MSRITKSLQKNIILLLSYPVFRLDVYFTTNSACSLVSILALLLVVLCRMFFHHVSLESRGLSALIVAVESDQAFPDFFLEKDFLLPLSFPLDESPYSGLPESFPSVSELFSCFHPNLFLRNGRFDCCACRTK